MGHANSAGTGWEELAGLADVSATILTGPDQSAERSHDVGAENEAGSKKNRLGLDE